MKLIEVIDKKGQKLFLDTAKKLYKNDPVWVCPLDKQINNVFDPKVNVFFKNGVAKRWILLNNNNELIGRIAAFINYDKAYGFDQPTGGCGFFECINDQNAANMLFDQAQQWLMSKGMEAMDGPINFGENDNFWGLLVEGFTHPGFGMQYNPPYYKELFENYGFKFYFEQVSNHLDLTKEFPSRFWKIAEYVKKRNPDIHVKHFNYKQKNHFIKAFIEVYKEAWEFHENFVPIKKEDIVKTLTQNKGILIEEFIWFAYYKDEPIAFLVMFPDINQILRHMNGKMHLWNKIRFKILQKRKAITRARIIIMGVKPKFQKSGVESIIFWHMDKMMKNFSEYSELELSWVGDFNPKMRALHESVGAKFGKRHITYRKLFKDDSDFKRSKIIPNDTKEKLVKNKKETA